MRQLCVLTLLGSAGLSSADEVLFRYEADVLPYDTLGGFIIADACAYPPCSEGLENGRFVLEWEISGGFGGDYVNYSRMISGPGEEPPPTMWMEWRFRSNYSLPWSDVGCGGRAAVQFRNIVAWTWLHGNAVVDPGEANFIVGLLLNEFYTLRFESYDGSRHTWAVDGRVYATFVDRPPGPGSSIVQFGGSAACNRPDGTTIRNEWDFVRYGTLGNDEAVVSADPPQGVVDTNTYPDLDRFRVTFDRPGFVYVDDVTVATTGGDVPIVLWVRRPDGGEPDTVEIVLDRAIPFAQTTTFTFNTGGSPNTVEYTVLSLGACCLADGSCMVSEETECASLAGSFTPGAACSAPQSCCLNGECLDLDPLCCSVASGFIPGAASTYDPRPAQGATLQAGGNAAFGPCDFDSDGDGIDAACGDACPADPDKTSPGPCGCGIPDSDADGDTVPDCLDQCPGADDRPDQDHDGIPDCLDFRPIPTTTAWGLAVLTLTLLVAAKLRRVNEERLLGGQRE